MGKRVAIIGAGAAGCFCAVNLGRKAPELEIHVFEAGPKALAKVAITGGGRCNLTNSFAAARSLGKVYPRGERLMSRALKAWSQNDTWEWFENEGVPLVLQDDQCVFPQSQDAMDIVGTLVRGMRQAGVNINYGARVESIEAQSEGGYSISFTKSPSGAQRSPFTADYVIVTTGGSPRSEGLSFLSPLGLEMVDPVPSLFTFNVPDKDLRALMGTVVENAAVSLCGTKLCGEGPLLITHWGLSGPAALKLSSYGARILAEHSYRAEISVNWMPGKNDQDIRGMLSKLLGDSPQKMLSGVHPAELPSRLWEYLLDRSGLRGDIRCAEVGKKGINRLVETLMNSGFRMDGKSRFREEFVTCGGVALSGISLNTLESKKHPGLYFAGEVLDVDAITGGFNLQAAWSMGYIVAESILSTLS